MTPIVIGSEIFGDARAVATKVTGRRIVVGTHDTLPIGSVVLVEFGKMTARAEVKSIYRYAHADGSWSGMGLRVLGWE